jgi:hypothetical protein
MSRITIRKRVTEIPANAIQCNKPLMYSLNRFITPDGKLFSQHLTTNVVTEIKVSKDLKWSWTDATMIDSDGEIQPMKSIEGLFSKNGKCIPHAVLAYYFAPIADLTNMRAIISQEPSKYDTKRIFDINQDSNLNQKQKADAISKIRQEIYIRNLHIDNIRWGTKYEQDCARSTTIRKKVDSKNIHKETINLDNLDEYTQIFTTEYYIKNDGKEVIKKLSSNEFKPIELRNGSDGYTNVMLYLDASTAMKLLGKTIDTTTSEGNRFSIRINRLMAALHNSVDISDPKIVIDHKNGRIEDNYASNLESVTLQENTRRGQSACTILKVHPTTMIVEETIQCAMAYAEDNSNSVIKKTLLRVKNTGEQYNGFIWLDTSLDGILFHINSDSKVILSEWSEITNVLKYAQYFIHKLYQDKILNELMLPLDANGMVVPSTEINTILDQLDPRGTGDHVQILNETNDRIQKHIPCCRLISIHANGNNPQLVICLKTMIVFARSRENLSIVTRTCPLCTMGNRIIQKSRFQGTGPEMSIPIYSYNPAAGKRAQDNPLGFVDEYLTVGDALGGLVDANNELDKARSDMLLGLRKSLFGIFNKSTDHWIKSAGTFPKRKVYNDLYWSFYPPVNGKLSETNPDWLLSRRLNCTVMVHLNAHMQTFQKKY